MLNSKKLIMMALLILLASAPIMAIEKGSARFSFQKPIFVSGTEINPGTYDVKYEANDQDATVAFIIVGKPKKIEVKGKVQNAEKKSEDSSLGTGKDSQGRDSIKRMSFRGKTLQIVFE